MEKKKVSKKGSVITPSKKVELDFIAELTRLRVTHYKKDDVEIVIHPSAFASSSKPTREVGDSKAPEKEIDYDEMAFQAAYTGGKS